jgi:hypothetical protein
MFFDPNTFGNPVSDHVTWLQSVLLISPQFGGDSLPPFGANPEGDVLQDFDFDSFLHQDGDVQVGEPFNFGDGLDFDAIGAE